MVDSKAGVRLDERRPKLARLDETRRGSGRQSCGDSHREANGRLVCAQGAADASRHPPSADNQSQQQGQ